MKTDISKRSIIALPFTWLIIFFLVPFILIGKISLSDPITAQPPYTPTIEVSKGIDHLTSTVKEFDFENYQLLIDDKLYWVSYLHSLKVALISTIITFLIAYPIAYAIFRAPKRNQTVLLMLVILPFWTSFLIRIYAWIGILKNDGFLNHLLLSLHIIDTPLVILNTNLAVYIGIVYAYLPYMILPIYASLSRLDNSLLEAAYDMGCTKMKAFLLVTLPLSLPGIIAGFALVFIPAIGEFVIPDLLGGSNTLMIGKVLWVEFFNNTDWTVASAIAVTLLFFLIIPIIGLQKIEQQSEKAK